MFGSAMFLHYPSKQSPLPQGFPAQSSILTSHNSPSYPGRHSHKPSTHVPWSHSIAAHGSALGIFHSALRPARPAVPSDWKLIRSRPNRVHRTVLKNVKQNGDPSCEGQCSSHQSRIVRSTKFSILKSITTIHPVPSRDIFVYFDFQVFTQLLK